MALLARQRTNDWRPFRLRRAIAALALGAAWLYSGPAGAAPITSPATLSSLLAPGATMTVPGATFSDFSFTTPNPGGTPSPNPASITVTGTLAGSPGLVFSGTGFQVMGSQTIQDVLSFDVTSTNSSQGFNSAGLNFLAGTNGAGSASIVENILNSASQQLGQGAVVQEQGMVNGGVPSATISFADQNTIQVIKGITLTGSVFGSNNLVDYANIVDFSQDFGFSPPLPEPASFAMMLLGGGTLLGFRWRRRRSGPD